MEKVSEFLKRFLPKNFEEDNLPMMPEISGAVLLGMVLLLAIVVGVVSVKLNGGDNPIEEVANQIIEDTTGIDIDISDLMEEDELDEGVLPACSAPIAKQLLAV